MKLFEIISSAAFVFADEDVLDDVVISISGDYMTGWYRARLTVERPHSQEWEPFQDGPVQHGCGVDESGLGVGGLYGADAAKLYDAAAAYLAEIANPIQEGG